jgi:hypothetical protein
MGMGGLEMNYGFQFVFCCLVLSGSVSGCGFL